MCNRSTALDRAERTFRAGCEASPDQVLILPIPAHEIQHGQAGLRDSPAAALAGADSPADRPQARVRRGRVAGRAFEGTLLLSPPRRACESTAQEQ